MKNSRLKALVAAGASLAMPSYALGLRSFIALPLSEGVWELRTLYEHNKDNNTEVLKTSFAYGISGTQTIMAGMPYRIYPNGDNRTGNVTVLYRHLLHENLGMVTTYRLSLLAGGKIPTTQASDGAVEAGLVGTYTTGKHQFDADMIGRTGLGITPNTGQYDLSWQYRLYPDEYPEWGFPHNLKSIVEFGGRWTEGSTVVQQGTLGLQYIMPQWVIEGGLTKDLNVNYTTTVTFSMRWHF